MQKRIYILLFSLFLVKSSFSQSILVNSVDSLFNINQSGSLCSFTFGGLYCNRSAGSTIFSSALQKDTLFFIDRKSVLYRMKIGDLSTCSQLATLPLGPFGSTAINALTVDKNGIVYAADGMSGDLFRYNPFTNTVSLLGRLSAVPGGDLIFYKGKLLMAALNGSIYEVNINDPSASPVYMAIPGLVFFGLISVPFDCTRNKYYGLEGVNGVRTQLYELDLDNKVIVGAACQLPFLVYDGASGVDDGTTLGVTIDSIHIQPACGTNTLADIQVRASTASPGALTYVLDGITANSTGIFSAVNEGPHTVRVTNSINCTKDSSFTIYHGLSPNVNMTIVNPRSCDMQDGTVTIAASSGYPPLRYSLNGGTFQSNPVFNNLGGGRQLVSIMDAKGCRKDTTVYLQYQQFPSFLAGFTIAPTICNSKTGSISISLSPGTNPADITAALNYGIPQSLLSFGQLDSGQHVVSVIYQGNCRYDTLVLIGKSINPEPAISVTVKDQACLINNGSAGINLMGAHGPYLVSFNNGLSSGTYLYTNLAPGIYPIRITDIQNCISDTAIEIKPYPALPVTVITDKTDPTCDDLTGGRITATITGDQSPYRFIINNRVYNNVATAAGLSKGTYKLIVLNNDNCAIDTVDIVLNLELTPACDFLFVPTAFTPNNDGLNDLFRANAGEGITRFDLKVYNRWGQLLFSTTEKTKGWDGKINGVIQPNAVFVWVITYATVNDPERKTKRGTVTLIR